MGGPRKLDQDDFIRMNLPREFWPARSDVIAKSAYPSIHNYGTKIGEMLRDGLGFVFYGPAGVGKTGAAAVLAKIAKCYGHSVLFVTISDLRELARSRIDFDDKQSMNDRSRDVELLILDNLRMEDAKETIVNAASLEALLEHRGTWKRSTIITTRMMDGELTKAFSGLMEKARATCAFLPIQGENLRDKAEKELEQRLIVRPTEKK